MQKGNTHRLMRGTYKGSKKLPDVRGRPKKILFPQGKKATVKQRRPFLKILKKSKGESSSWDFGGGKKTKSDTVAT